MHTEQVTLWCQAAAHVRLAPSREQRHVADDAEAEVQQGLKRPVPEPRSPRGEADIIGARSEQGGLAKDIFVHQGEPQAV
jgi:hypothetical protein